MLFLLELATYLLQLNRPSAPTAVSPSSSSFTVRHSHSQSPVPADSGRGTSSVVLSSSRTPSTLDLHASDPLILKTKKVWVQRPRSQAAYQEARRRGQASSIEWEDIEVDSPDLEDRGTVLTLAQMTSNAYTLPSDEAGWFPLENYNHTIPIGWDPNAERLRGHIFADDSNSTVIISIKGTSAGLLGSGGPTVKNDRFNDNLLLCCCARVDFSWSTVCDCFGGGNKCGLTCVENALIEESVYYPIGTNLFNNVTVMYPDSQIWVVGHSLGGALASLLGVTFGVPAVAFESPGEKVAAGRLHLPLPPGSNDSSITHIYHTADPIAMGTCTGASSSCYIAGFALETHCHLGKSIVYDTVNKLGWSVDIRTHRISDVIARLLDTDWNDGDKDEPPSKKSSGTTEGKQGGNGTRRPVPKAEAEIDCVDCFKWEFTDDVGKKEAARRPPH